jgi:hypothetical protein
MTDRNPMVCASPAGTMLDRSDERVKHSEGVGDLAHSSIVSARATSACCR